jgi:predicted HAD superfamily phosphohydrolase
VYNLLCGFRVIQVCSFISSLEKIQYQFVTGGLAVTITANQGPINPEKVAMALPDRRARTGLVLLIFTGTIQL